MKKNYSTPKFKLVELNENDIICSSPNGDGGWTGITNANGGQADAKQRTNIWGDD